MEPAIKNDRTDDKVRMELLPMEELYEIAKVYTAGAKKYGAHQWPKLANGYERYKGAMLRHLREVERGEAIDTDTGCLHAAQVAWNAIAMLHFKLEEHRKRKAQGRNYKRSTFGVDIMEGERFVAHLDIDYNPCFKLTGPEVLERIYHARPALRPDAKRLKIVFTDYDGSTPIPLEALKYLVEIKPV